MSDERVQAGRTARPRVHRRWRGVPAACWLLAMLGGFGAATPGRANHQLTATTTVIDFGGVAIGSSAMQNITLVNVSLPPFSSTGTIGITGNLPGSEFSITDALPPI